MKRALVIGSGSIAKRHIRNLKALEPSVEIFCVGSSGREISKEEVGPASILTGLNEGILNSPEIAIIASPSSHHLRHARECLEAAIPVLIEKPLCSDLQELDSLNLCKENGKIGIAYNLRFLPAASFVKNFLGSNHIGRIHTVFCQVGQYLPDWRPEINFKKSVSAQRALGGGALLELSHELDYLNWFFGNFDSVSALMTNSGSLGIDVEENVDAILTGKLGLVCHLHLDFLQRPASRTFKAMGENGSVKWDLIENRVILSDRMGNSSTVFSDSKYDKNDMYLDQLRAFVSFCNGEGQFHSNLESATEVMRLVTAIRQADETGNRVRVGDLR